MAVTALVAVSNVPVAAVVGGTDLTVADFAVSGDYPWLVEVNAPGGISCTGFVVASEWVLTAAHCGAPNEVRYGSPDSATGTSVAVVAIQVHPSYDPSIPLFDAQLVQVAAPIPGAVAPLARPSSVAGDGVRPGDRTMVAGFGVSSADGIGAGVARVGMTRINIVEAALLFDAPDPSSSCSGDSGGPLIIERFGARQVIGIASFVESAGCDGLGGWVRVSAIRSWVDSVAGTASGVQRAPVIGAATTVIAEAGRAFELVWPPVTDADGDALRTTLDGIPEDWVVVDPCDRVGELCRMVAPGEGSFRLDLTVSDFQASVTGSVQVEVGPAATGGASPSLPALPDVRGTTGRLVDLFEGLRFAPDGTLAPSPDPDDIYPSLVATIDPGDGSVPLVVRGAANGWPDDAGFHVYTGTGEFTRSVTVCDPAGNCASATSFVLVPPVVEIVPQFTSIAQDLGAFVDVPVQFTVRPIPAAPIVVDLTVVTDEFTTLPSSAVDLPTQVVIDPTTSFVSAFDPNASVFVLRLPVSTADQGTIYIAASSADAQLNLPQFGIIVSEAGSVGDLDRDLLFDHDEIALGTDLSDADTDDDGLADGFETGTRFGDPLDFDSDDDGISDGVERGISGIGQPDTDPGVFQPDLDPYTQTRADLSDTDGGGVSDGEEDTNRNGRVDEGEGDPRNSNDDFVAPPPPVAFDDEFLSAPGTAASFDVLANDVGTENGVFVSVVWSDPSVATVTSDGTTIQFRPNRTFTGGTAFVYEVCNDGGCSTAIATVTVAAPGRLPVPVVHTWNSDTGEPVASTLTVPSGTRIELDASRSLPSARGTDIVKWTWRMGRAVIGTASSVDLTVASGRTRIDLTLVDDTGASATLRLQVTGQ